MGKTNVWDRSNALGPEEACRDYVTQRAINSILLLSFEKIPLEQFLNQTLEIILSLPWVSFLDRGAIFLADRDSGLLTPQARAGMDQAICQILTHVPVERLVSRMCAHHEGVRTGRHIQSRNSAPGEVQGHYTVPLAIREKVFGVLCLKLKARWSVSPSEEDSLAAAAKALAVILERKEMERLSEMAEMKLREDLLYFKEKSQDLEDFACVAAHDLREPLRTIETFGDLLIRKSPEGLGEKALDYIGRIRKAAGRMRAMIDSLLAYSGILASGQSFAQVNLREAVDEALTNLEVRLGETGAKVSVGALPSIEADRPQMLRLFQNLICNALKFHHKDTPPRIRIYSDPGQRTGFCRILVEDDGIGIEEKNLERIFLPFERLHSKGKYEGSGMGLSICKRIVGRHGGSIKAESSPGIGTTFTVTLPEKNGESPSCTSPREEPSQNPYCQPLEPIV